MLDEKGKSSNSKEGPTNPARSVAFLINGLTLILASISNYINYQVWDEITNPFVNFNECPSYAILCNQSENHTFEIELKVKSPSRDVNCMIYFITPQVPLNQRWDLFYQHGLTLISTWINNHMPSEVWDEMTSHTSWCM